MEDALREDLAILLRRRPDLKVVALADGAPEMQSILDRATAGHVVTAALIDFWHVLEHLGEAATAAGENASEVVPRFRRELLEHDDAIHAIEVELRTWAVRFASEETPDVNDLHGALTYVRNNGARMRYASVHAAGLPIGSGTVEATGKTIVETRMRRAGARWDEDGAQPILALRALTARPSTTQAVASEGARPCPITLRTAPPTGAERYRVGRTVWRPSYAFVTSWRHLRRWRARSGPNWCGSC
jgi:hypothetical protein